MKALEEALAQERARNEAEERAHAEATTKAQADAARKDAIEAARRKVAEERANPEAELAALEEGESSAAAGSGSRGCPCPGGGRKASCGSHVRRNGGGGSQAPAQHAAGRIPSGDPSKALRKGRLLQDDA